MKLEKASPWVLLILLVVGVGVRLPHLATPPLEFHAARQYHSALLARSYYLSAAAREPDWRRSVSEANRPQLLEPPIMEYVAAAMYRLTGLERLWLPRLLSVLLWVGAAFFFYRAASSLFSRRSALLAVAFYLFAPFGVIASRSFQPEPLLIWCLTAAIAMLAALGERQSVARLIWLCVVSGVGTLVKPNFAFLMLPTVGLVWIARFGVRRAFRDRWLYISIFAMFLLAGVFYGGRVLRGDGALIARTQISFFPSLFSTSSYWQGWLAMIDGVVGVPAGIAGLAGTLLAPSGIPRALLGGLWLGYLGLGLSFNYHIHTHDYYSLPLVPIVGLGIASLVHAALQFLATPRGRMAGDVTVAGLVVCAIVWGGGQARRSTEERGLDAKREKLEMLGALVEHSRRLITLDGAYGYSLFYHGETAGSNWPMNIDFRLGALQGRREDDAADRLRRFGDAEYFVITYPEQVAKLRLKPTSEA